MKHVISRHELALVGSLIVAACDGSDGSGGDGTPVSPDTPPPFTLERAFPNLQFISPVAMIQAPGDSTRWFVVEQPGEVRVFDNNPTVTSGNSFIDIRGRVISGGELGLLGMAFHPGFPNDPRVFLSYTHNDTTGGLGLVSRISVFTMSNVGLTLDPTSEQVLITIVSPEDNHNGGGIVFGPDGFLYIGMGDGGGANDEHPPIGNGQLLTTLLGKMLRIDIATGANGMLYSIPTDNPFAANAPCGALGTGSQECPEIYAWGFRNPWRWSFDRATGDLWVGDVGQSALEEVDRVVRGGNYGWRCFEGTRSTGLNCGPVTAANPPVAEYGRSVGTTVTGGYVYNGTAVPELVGHYVFGDFGSGRMWAIAADTAPTLTMTNGAAFASDLNISSFAEDNDGELYVVHHGGTLHRVVAN
jgi:glucose/arabinose dehydrogenase